MVVLASCKYKQLYANFHMFAHYLIELKFRILEKVLPAIVHKNCETAYCWNKLSKMWLIDRSLKSTLLCERRSITRILRKCRLKGF